jgi:murein DD-endopeptidase MepM/ murein hydrolase activator NlpD
MANIRKTVSSLTTGRQHLAYRSKLVKSAIILVCLIAVLTGSWFIQTVYAASPAPTPTPTSPAPSTPASPTGSVEELQQQQRKIETERSNIDQEKDRLQNQQKSAQKELSSLQSSIKATSTEISKNEKQLQQASQRLKRLEQELTISEKTYNVQQKATVARLRFLQRQRGSYGWAVLLQSKNLNDFLDRRYQLRRVYQSDRQILAKLKADTDTITQKRQQVESQKNEIALLTQQLMAQKLDYQQEAKQQQALINRLRLDHKALEAAEMQLAKDSDNIAIMIQQRLGVKNPSAVLKRGKGLLSYPSDGILTSGFGYRIHPILGYARFHSGLDFGADYGTPIRAAMQGKVLFAGWYGGYGQTVVIDHGNNVTTLYGHASEVYVSEGQVIQRGTSIAAVGSTGFSTGPHLHFEVRVGGEPVDPAEYL